MILKKIHSLLPIIVVLLWLPNSCYVENKNKDQADRINKLEKECEDLKKRLAALEEKLLEKPPGGDCKERNVA